MTREYPNRPLVGIGIAVLRPGEVLLIKRGRAPSIGSWSLPGGAQRVGETAEDAARRELAEETGLTVGDLHLAGHVDSIHRDADGRVQYHYTILDFCALWREGEAKAGGDAMEATWASLQALEPFLLWDPLLRIISLAERILHPGAHATGL